MSMVLSSNGYRNMPKVTAMTAPYASDRHGWTDQPTCKQVVRGSSPLVGSTSDQALLRSVAPCQFLTRRSGAHEQQVALGSTGSFKHTVDKIPGKPAMLSW